MANPTKDNVCPHGNQIEFCVPCDLGEAPSSNQCGVKGCKNTRDSGAFAGPFCAPCDHDLRTGNFEFGTSVVYEQARKIERAKRIMQRAISWLQIKEAAFTTHKGPAIIEEMQRYVGDLPVETTARLASDIRCRHAKYLTEPCVACEQLSSEGGERIVLLGEDGVLTRLTMQPEEPTETLTPRYECHVCGRKYLTIEVRDHHQEECTDASEAWRQEKATEKRE